MGLSQVITVRQPHFWRKRMNGILCADMDNTIIYSYKRNIGENKLNVELYNGREISFISEKTHDLLKKVNEKITIIPTSTRTEEQYKRIDLDIGIVPYALVCNGGVLLVNGVKRQRVVSGVVANDPEQHTGNGKSAADSCQDSRRKLS